MEVNCCYQAWLLKNSLAGKSPKKLCDKKPYKRRSPFWQTFGITQISAVLTKQEFFNSHRPFHSKPLLGEDERNRDITSTIGKAELQCA